MVYTPCISKAPIYGATLWIKNNTLPLIQITDRQKDYNAFWFTFYHELAHILYHGKKEIFIDGGPMLKRFSPRAMGRATRILKRTSHITVVVDEA